MGVVLAETAEIGVLGGARALGVRGLRALGVLGLYGRGWLAAKVVTEAGVCDGVPSVLARLVVIECGCIGTALCLCRLPGPFTPGVGGGGGRGY